MIRPESYIVTCDVCNCRYGPRFVAEWQAERWLADDDDDFEEHGMLHGEPRPTEIYLRIGGKLLCKRCAEAEIKRTKGTR